MSSRACIARLIKRSPVEFKGVFNHSDSDPRRLGWQLYTLRNGTFEGDTDAMLRMLIDKHSAGWVSIYGSHFGKPDGKCEARWDEVNRCITDAECFCHRYGYYRGRPVTHKTFVDFDVAYVYAFDGAKMLVLYMDYSRTREERTLTVLAEVDLDDAQPDWDAVEASARGDIEEAG